VRDMVAPLGDLANERHEAALRESGLLGHGAFSICRVGIDRTLRVHQLEKSTSLDIN
jgi:hypothetical protein